jgi:hypothetical protein
MNVMDQEGNNLVYLSCPLNKWPLTFKIQHLKFNIILRGCIPYLKKIT